MDIWNRLKREEKPILLYGMGDGAEKILSVLNERGIEIQGIFVSDNFVRDKSFHGFKLLSFSQAQSIFKSFIVLVAFGTSRQEVLDNIKAVSSKQQLYVPDVPVAGNQLFDHAFAKQNEEKIRFVYNKLETNEDRYIYESVIRFKMTGWQEYLHRSHHPKARVYEKLCLNEGAVCIDCGAFTGDTVSELLMHNSCNTVYAIEPDAKTFKKLKLYSETDSTIVPINAAVSDNENGVTFSAHGNRGSKSADNGTLVPSVCIDKLVKDAVVDYIKFDVEGMEAEAINGAAETIKKFKPKMLVSCYHRSEDVFELPMKILSIRNDYKLHIYHPCYLPAWDCAFLFV